ncbi:hypothetical protein [Agrobacterium tumefaciens]|uniref:hypothetical protein n=1 Tax=Agrobacterium tumefaciens TaxID=358 RepID=UPI001F277165
MTFQFVHLESWSRKPDGKGRSTDFVFDEVTRRPSASLHVQNPKPPTTIYGMHVEQVRTMHDAAAAVAMTPGARGKLRKIAVSQKTFLFVKVAALRGGRHRVSDSMVMIG